MNTLHPTVYPISAKPSCAFCSDNSELDTVPFVRNISKKEKIAKPKHVVVQHPYFDFFPQRNIFEFDSITFDSNFETGNLKRVIQVAHDQYDLWIAPDCYQTQYKIPQKAWFHFRISNLALNEQETRTICFTLKNISTNQETNWEGGMVPVYLSKPHKTRWDFIPEPLTAYIKRPSLLEVGFQFEFTKEDKEVHFASTFPYSYTDALNYATELENKFKNDSDIYFHREHLIDSLEGRRLDLITITGKDTRITNEKEEIPAENYIPNLFPNRKLPFSDRPIKFSNKKYVLFGARIHPGEHAANYMLQGFIDNLLNKDDIVSKTLLENFVFVIIPMLNPDGVARGHYRVDTKGRDLNRIYDQADPSETPGPYAFTEVAKELSRDGRLFMVIDFHAHGLEDAAFIYANYVPSDEKRAEIREFIRLMDIYSKTFDIDKCHYGNNPRLIPPKEGVAKNHIYYQTGITHIYTLEVSYNRGTKHPERYAPLPRFKYHPKFQIPMRTKKYTLNISDFMEVGDSLRHAILELVDLHPCSMISKTIYRSIENVRLQAKYEEEERKGKQN